MKAWGKQRDKKISMMNKKYSQNICIVMWLCFSVSIAVLLASYSFPRPHNSSPLKMERFFFFLVLKKKKKERGKKRGKERRKKKGKNTTKTFGERFRLRCHPSGVSEVLLILFAKKQ